MFAFSDSVVFLVVCCCFNIYIQQTNTADPSQEKIDLSDSSSGKWKNDKPVKKTEESLCLSYNGSDKQRKLCTVVINNQSIASDVDQEGSFRVYQNEELCILCMHNLHFANDSINKNIHLEYGLHRIVSTTLKDILEKGLVDYEIIVKNDQEAEIYIMNYGLQAKCTSKPMVNKTVMTTKLIFKDGEIVKLHQTQILYNRCSSFDISCSFGSMDYPLDIPTYCGNPSFLNQEPVSLCAGKEVTTKFVYNDSAVKFTDLSVINWTVRKTKQDKAEIFSYYDKAVGFKIRTVPGDRFKDRVTWVNNTINLKFSDLNTNDTGIYDVDITIFEGGKEESKDINGTFQLTVNAKDNCENNGEGKSTGTIVGIVVGLLVLLIITLVIVLVKKRKDTETTWEINSYYAVAFEDRWYPGVVTAIKGDNKDWAFVKYMHPSGENFKWGKEVLALAHINDMLCRVNVNSLANGRLWTVANIGKIDDLYKSRSGLEGIKLCSVL